MKRLLIPVLLVAAAVAAALSATPFLVSTDMVATALTRHVLGWTGQTLAFSGTPAVRFDHGLSIRFQDARIGPADAPLAEMDALVVRVGMLALLFGRLETKSFELDRPHFHLSPEAAHLARYAFDDDPVKSRFGRVMIRSGTLVYRDAAGAPAFSADAIDAEFDWPSTAAAFDAHGWLAWRGEPVEFGATIANPAALADGRSTTLRLSLGAKPVRASFSGTTQTAGGFVAEGQLSLSTASLRDLSAWLDGPGGSGATFGPASVEGRARLAADGLSFSQATLRLDGNEAEGALSLSPGTARPALAGTLALDRLDLTPYADALVAATGGPRRWSTFPVPTGLLDALDIDLRLSANEVLTGRVRLGRSAAALNISAGRLAASLGEAQLLGGRLVGSLDLGPKAGGAAARLSARLDGIPARLALSDLLGLGAVDGIGGGEVTLGAQGATLGALIGSLSGDGRVRITRGTIAGLDVGAIVRAVNTGSFSPLNSLVGGSTGFEQLTAGLSIGDGEVRTGDLSIRGSGYTVELVGRAPIGTTSISGRGQLLVERAARRPDGPADTVPVPFLLGGHWDAPTLVPDFDGILDHADAGAAPGPIRLGFLSPR
ncbi:AsmA family protein [Prosthecomicrobium pneumaticum]|uniref:AsmA protein n=1 Tax=Prosthecomicrobium pneumaticum TaxID=81895 RepID=A0A7W9CVJ9_9HYPH|nr:AsmA-like C-terminal region-containing protein [Prosthecomicrobium pneumaticum]MBB5752316.1 AsmA protein [Prosthecomicrobium pneumaticum]